MTLVSVQCPNCGAPVDAPRIGTTVTCPSCHSTLSIKAGSSGYPLAQLVAIGQDTGFIAKRQAAERLQEQIDRLSEERSAIEAEISEVENEYTAGCLTDTVSVACWLPAIVGVIFLFNGAEGVGYALVSFAIAAAMWFLPRAWDQSKHEERVNNVKQEHADRLAELDQAIQSRSAELARLEADLDRLTKEL